MEALFNEGNGATHSAVPLERTLKKKEVHNVAISNIGCPKEDKPMNVTHIASPSDTISTADVNYIRNLLAEGIARALVEKMAKKTESTVDK